MTKRQVYRIIKNEPLISRKKILEKLHSNDMEVLKAILNVLKDEGKIELAIAMDDNGRMLGGGYCKKREKQQGDICGY